jgi:hypothetical protein
MSGVGVRGNERNGVMQHKWFVRRNSAGQSIWRCTAIAVAITTATLLSGCTQLAPAPTDPLPASASPAPDVVMDQHSRATPTCAAATILESTLLNAHLDLERDAITDAQWVAVVNSTVIGFRSIAQQPDWGLQAEARSLIKYIDASSPSPSGALFNPDATEWDTLIQAFNRSCDANGTEVALWAATGG